MALVYKGDSATPITSNIYPEWAENRCILWVTPTVHAELTQDEAKQLQADLSELLRNW
jgi:hypothetical protein